jgi:hypothetical protein
MAIRDHLGVNIEIRSEDMMEAPEFSARGGIVRVRRCLARGCPGCARAAGRIDRHAGCVIYIIGIYQTEGGGS